MTDKQIKFNKLLVSSLVCEQCGKPTRLTRMAYRICCFCNAEYTLDGRQIRPINKLHSVQTGGGE